MGKHSHPMIEDYVPGMRVTQGCTVADEKRQVLTEFHYFC